MTVRKSRWFIPLAVIAYAILGSAVLLFSYRLGLDLNKRLSWMVLVGLTPLLVLLLKKFQARKISRHTPLNMSNEVQQPIYLIKNAQVHTASRQVYFDDTAIEIQPKAFDLLVYLIQHNDRVVSKEELLDNVWPAVVVSESSLTQSIKRIRDVFRKHATDSTNDIIRTVSRKGYQLDSPVSVTHLQQQVIEPGPSAFSAPRITFFVTLLLLVLIWNIEPVDLTNASRESNSPILLVLPFNDLTQDESFSYFTEGLTETVTSALTREANIRVISSASARKVSTIEDDYLTVGQQLGIDHMVLGSVQKQDNILRINAKLIRVENGEQLWSQSYTRELNNVFTLHDEIARQIVSESVGTLFLPLTNAVDEITDAQVSEEASQAYLLNLQASRLVKLGKNKQLEEATRLFRQALELKPDYPEALVGLSQTIVIRTTIGELQRESGFSEALILAKRAAEIDEKNVDAWIQIGEIQHRHFWDFAKAEKSYKQALKVSPSSAAVHSAYGRFLSKTGRYKEAVIEAERALKMDPLSGHAATSLTIRLIRARKLERAREVLNTFKKRYKDDPNIPWLETNYHIRNGDYQMALQWIALEELDYLRLALSAVALHHLGRTGQAQKTLNDLISTDADGAAFQIAEVYAQWSKPDLAFLWLEKAFEQGDPGITELYSSVNLESLYADKRFHILAKKVGLPKINLQPIPST